MERAARATGYLIAAALTALAFPATAATDDVAAGREIAIDACSACHKVTSSQAQPAPVPDRDEMTEVKAPSFAVIAKLTGGDERILTQAITEPKHPMREQEWRPEDLKVVIAYIRSLKHQTW